MSRVVNVVALGGIWLLAAAHVPALAEQWPRWADEAFGRSDYGAYRH